jgi:hypothetical protein
MMRRNPYNYNLPVDTSMFFGRQRDVAAITGSLTDSLGDSVALIGGRRMGKTSLLEALTRALEAQATSVEDSLLPVPIFIDLSGEPIDTTDKFFGMLVERTQAALDGIVTLPMPGGASGAALPAPLFRRVLEGWSRAVLDQLGRRFRLIVLLDECEEIVDRPWAPELHGSLRSLLVGQSTRSLLKVVMVGSHGFLMQVRQRGSPLWNVLSYHMLRVLEDTAARELIMRPIGGTLSAPVADAVMVQAGGHAFLTQYLMYHLWECGLQIATITDVQRIAEAFAHLRNDFTDWARAFGEDGVAVYSALMQSAHALTEDELHATIPMLNGGIAQPLGALCYHGVAIVEPDGQHYRLQGQMFREWFERSYSVRNATAEVGSPGRTQPDQTRRRPNVRTLIAQLPKDAHLHDFYAIVMARFQRYELLEQREAQFGIATPPEVILELAQTAHQLELDVAQLNNLVTDRAKQEPDR